MLLGKIKNKNLTAQGENNNCREGDPCCWEGSGRMQGARRKLASVGGRVMLLTRLRVVGG